MESFYIVLFVIPFVQKKKIINTEQTIAIFLKRYFNRIPSDGPLGFHLISQKGSIENNSINALFLFHDIDCVYCVWTVSRDFRVSYEHRRAVHMFILNIHNIRSRRSDSSSRETCRNTLYYSSADGILTFNHIRFAKTQLFSSNL